MAKILIRFLSMLLTIVMVINLLPINILATEIQEAIEDADINDEVVNAESTGMEDAYIVEEVIDGRTEYSKEYRLSNGLHMAAMYVEPVHYETDGKWEEIDNTLRIYNGMYVNTAGVWDVSFPQELNINAPVTITKDGYTLSFYMDGEMRSNSSNLEVAAIGGEAKGYTLQGIQLATGQIQNVDLSSAKEASQFPEAISDKNHSRLQYQNVFSNTDIRYDLQANQVKESIIIDSYDADLRGYQYTLNVGELTPILMDNGEIQLYDGSKENVVLVMPAPFLIDNAGEYSTDVVVALSDHGSTYTLTYTLPQSWLADEERQWPVILDPVVDAGTKTSNIRDVSVYEKNTPYDNTDPVLEVGHNSNNGIMRIFLKYRNLPKLTSADVIVASRIYLPSAYSYQTNRVIEAHKVLGTWESESITWANQPDFNPLIEDYATVNEEKYYSWDITDIVREWYEGENTGIMFKARDYIENTSTSTSYRTQFFSSDYSTYTCPQLIICFRNNNGLESYWDYTASSVGRAGTGYVNNYTGNLVWVRSDIGFGGNRMPVSISHVYNANDSQNNKFGMGYGWRTNFNQLVYQWIEDSEYYVWEDSDGTKHYFKKVSSGKYEDEDGLEMTLTTTGSGTSKYKIVDKNGNASYFDTEGRLTKQENNQATKSSISITYTSASSKLISKITDGAGRKYTFAYSSSLLNKISYTGSGTTELAHVSFGYNSSKLTTVTDQDSEKCTYAYGSNNLLTEATDIDGYKLSYTYTSTTAGKPNRIAKVCEYDGNIIGGELTIAYAHNQTTFTDVSGNVQILQFNNWGNTVSIQDGEGRAQYAQYANNDATSTSNAKGNQLTLVSKLQNTVGNVLNNSSFEGANTWTISSSAVTQTVSTDSAYYGIRSLKLSRSTSGSGDGVSGPSFAVKKGETYTFSTYLKTGNLSGYIALTNGTTTVTSTTVAANSDWTRVEVPFTASQDTTVTPKLLVSGSGSMYMDCVQIEKAPTASRYNLVENGDFRHGTEGWSFSDYCNHDAQTEKPVTLSSSAVPQLDSTVFQFAGDPTVMLQAYNSVQISGSEGDTFVVAGWAKGKSVAMTEENGCTRRFAIQLRFFNTDGTRTNYMFEFNPDVDDTWQYRSGVAIAKKSYSKIQIQLIYDYNMNTVYFDGIQLYKEEFGTSYTYDEDGNVISVVDLQKQLTEYEYENNDLKGVTLPTGAKLEYDYDDYHNVTSATTEEGLKYEFTYDKWGNNLSVSAVQEKDGVTKKITSTANYSDDGNRLEFTVDPLGNETQYSYNADTNMLEWIQYPEDTSSTRTTYTYDEMYRVATNAAATDTGHSLSTVYTYEDDLLKKLETPSTTYDFAYGNFALRSSIKIGERTLAQYSYEDRTNRLTELDYGNGGEVKYTYDQQGRTIRETYEDDSYVSYEYDNSGALATVFDSSTGITSTYYYDFTDRLMRYVEQGEGFNHTLQYTYDDINNLDTIVDTINGINYTTAYDYDFDNRVKSVTNGSTSEHYEYDDFGRLEKRITKNEETELFTEVYTYRDVNGSPTEQVENLTITSSVSGYSISYDYTYDSNGNITSIYDGVQTIRYTYDTANQLIREDNQGSGVTRVWTYDDAGNILTCCQYAYTTAEHPGEIMMTDSYTYGDSDWGDLLTAYNDHQMDYDEIGNLLNDGTWTYSWEHGRQLESMSAVGLNNHTTDVAIDFTYNSDGIRTSKTVTTDYYHVHEYTETVVEPTCTTVGYTLHTCECGYSYQSDQVDVTDHSYTDSVVEPTCTKSGYTLHECVCGDSYKTDYTDPLGHTYKWNKCTRCGYRAPEIIIPVEPPVELEPYCEEEPISTMSSIHIPIPIEPIERVLVSTVVTQYEYVYTGGKLMQMVINSTTTTAEGDISTTSDILNFTYDATGLPLTLTYDNATYYYVTNVQGDVVAILDSNGQSMVTYSYSAWGACTSISGDMSGDLGSINPLRYRGYVYDSETKLYYLQSRYYSPLRCRFINADTFASTGQGFLGHNAYAYCNNNPVINSDPEGQSAILTYLAFGVVGGIVNCGTSFLGAIITGQGFTMLDGCAAFASGFLCATNLSAWGALVSGFYTAYACTKNGASSGAAMLAGIFAGLMTYFVPGNLINLEKELANLGLQAFVDTIFGIGYNSSAAAVANMATPDNPGKNNTSTDNATSTTKTSSPQKRSTVGSSRGGGHPSITTACVCLY